MCFQKISGRKVRMYEYDLNCVYIYDDASSIINHLNRYPYHIPAVFQRISAGLSDMDGHHLSHYMAGLIMGAESGNGHHYIFFSFEISLLVIVVLPNF